jgi:hypothetical protein
MKDILKRMMEEMPVKRITFADQLSSSWVMVQAAVLASRPDDPGYDITAEAMAKIIKSEPQLRALPDLLALAEEVLGPDNVMEMPLNTARALDSTLIPIRKSQK